MYKYIRCENWGIEMYETVENMKETKVCVLVRWSWLQDVSCKFLCGWYDTKIWLWQKVFIGHIIYYVSTKEYVGKSGK